MFIEQKNNLGSDLEIIPDNDYVILRRHSCKDIPVFCMYGIVKDDLQVDEGTIEVVNGVYKGKAKYYLPHKMYKGFLDNSYGSSFTPWGYYSSAGHFLDELKCSLNKDKILYNSNLVSYDIDLSKEFFVEPTQDYSELFHKRKELNYQHEIRFILPNKPTRDKWIIHIDPLELNSADIAVGELYMEINVICEPLYNEGQTKA